MSERKSKKAFNFDLSIKNLKEFYPHKDCKQAYRDIKKFFKANGFKHRQWSGYTSEKPLSVSEVLIFAEKLWAEFPWLEKCATRFDVTNIGRTYDMLSMRLADKKAEKVSLPSTGQATQSDKRFIQQKNESVTTNTQKAKRKLRR